MKGKGLWWIWLAALLAPLLLLPVRAESTTTELPLQVSYSMPGEPRTISEAIRSLNRELCIGMEKTRQSALPLQNTAICFDGGEEVFMNTLDRVIAVFTVRMGWERPDQGEMDRDSLDLLRRLYWDMVWVVPVLEERSTPNGVQRTLNFYGGVSDAVVIGLKMGFTEAQVKQVLTMLDDPTVRGLYIPLGAGTDVLEEKGITLDPELSLIRRKVVEAAVSLVGRVDYTWGGKPISPGWEGCWGAPSLDQDRKVVPRGLDCSGFVGWAFGTAAGDMKTAMSVGYGSSTQWTNTEEVSMEEVQSGDIVWLASGDAVTDHVGVVIGRDREGRLAVCECNAHGVEITFPERVEYCRRPAAFYAQYSEESAPANIKRTGSSSDTRCRKGEKLS